MNLPTRCKNLIDWLVVGILLLLTTSFESLIPNNQRLFSLDDTSIMYPYTIPSNQRVTNFGLFLYSFLLPILIFLAFCLLSLEWRELNNVCLSFVFSVLNTTFVTNLLKKVVGRPRPDFLARCIPTAKHSTKVLYDSSICTQKNLKILNEGFKSFPSGHASIIFAGQTFLFFYLMFKLSPLGNSGLSFKYLILLAPISIALFVAASRSIDYWHHWQDILVGSIIGIVFAVYGYFFHFSALQENSQISSSQPSSSPPQNDYRMLSAIVTHESY